MRDSHLFSLKSIHEKFSGYYVDHNLTFYSAKRKGVETPVALKSSRFSKSQGFPFNVYELIDRLRISESYKSYCQNQRLASKMDLISINSENQVYIVVQLPDNFQLQDKNSPDFSRCLGITDSIVVAKEAAERLAIRNKGKTFAYFKLMGRVKADGVTWL